MTSFSRGLRSLTAAQSSRQISSRCLQFSTYPGLHSGHSRWSKIKHDKANVDAKRNRSRSKYSAELTTISKLYGGDPETNPRLAAAITTAKKAGFPKASVEAAIARGQGRSTDGAALEAITLEAILPPSIGLIVDIETDNRNRTLSDLRLVIKSHNGTVTPTGHLFERRGMVTFTKGERVPSNDLLDAVLEIGAEDFEILGEGNIIVWTEPSKTTATAKALAETWDLGVESSDLVWHPKPDTLVPMEREETAKALGELVEALRDNPDVRDVYTNVTRGTLDDKAWAPLQDKRSS